MRVLTVTSLFPSRTAPARGVFVLQRLRAVRDAGAEVRVVSPVPWAPPGLARYAELRATPRQEEIDGIVVRHPRYPTLPKVGMAIQDRTYASGIRSTLLDEIERYRPDLVDAHYLYPDACGVARALRGSGVPYVCSARGSDVKVLARVPYVGRRIRAALAGAAAVIAVSRDLAEHLAPFRDGPIDVVPNGVDADRFHPRDRAAARRELDLPEEGALVVCVGHLAPVHGQEILLRALALDPAGPRAVLVGGGADAARLRALVDELGLADRVRLTGAVPHDRVPAYFAAADASVHPGARAGSPNAILESLACGTPCLATDLPEMRDAVPTQRQGLLVPRTPEAFADGLARILERPAGTASLLDPPRSWSDVAREVLAVFERATSSRRSGDARG